ncbi:unnamed protein product, partial [Darwinula stevensoni]
MAIRTPENIQRVQEAAQVHTEANRNAGHRSFLSLPLGGLTSDTWKEHTEYFFIFGLLFLIQLEYINVKGNVGGHSQLAMHLQYHEPGVYIFKILLDKGIINNIVHDGMKNEEFEEQMLDDLVVILCYIFTNVSIPDFWKSCIEKKRKLKKWNSHVFLPKLDPKVKNVIEEYESMVRETFRFSLAFCSKDIKKRHGEECRLPLSGIEFPGIATSSAPPVGSLEFRLKESALKVKIVSRFSALSDVTDEDLIPNRHVIPDIRIEAFTPIEVLPLTKPWQRLNGYAWDFYRHGIYKCIETENRIRAGEAYNLLEDFRFLLCAITTSLEVLDWDEK